MTKRQAELINELGKLFLDKQIGIVDKKQKMNADEKTGAYLLNAYQFRIAYPILKELIG